MRKWSIRRYLSWYTVRSQKTNTLLTSLKIWALHFVCLVVTVQCVYFVEMIGVIPIAFRLTSSLLRFVCRRRAMGDPAGSDGVAGHMAELSEGSDQLGGSDGATAMTIAAVTAVRLMKLHKPPYFTACAVAVARPVYTQYRLVLCAYRQRLLQLALKDSSFENNLLQESAARIRR